MRTDAEVTAAAERTADLALRCAALTRQVEALEGQVAAVRALMDEWVVHTNDEELPWAHRVRWTVILAKLRAALDPAEESS